MFRCQLCHTVLPPHTPAGKVVIETRPKTYPPREGAAARRSGRSLRHSNRKPSRGFDRGGEGQEIVREIMVCPELAQQCHAEGTLPDLTATRCPFRQPGQQGLLQAGHLRDRAH